MTLQSTERILLEQRKTLTENEEFLLANTLDHLQANARIVGVPLANDDRCARVEAALIRYLLVSRPSVPSTKVVYNTANYTIEFDPANNRGSFEHNTRGEYSAGSLLFESPKPGSTELIDYDGVTQLPKEVLNCLKNHGFNVDGIDVDYP